VNDFAGIALIKTLHVFFLYIVFIAIFGI